MSDPASGGSAIDLDIIAHRHDTALTRVARARRPVAVGDLALDPPGRGVEPITIAVARPAATRAVPVPARAGTRSRYLGRALARLHTQSRNRRDDHWQGLDREHDGLGGHEFGRIGTKVGRCRLTPAAMHPVARWHDANRLGQRFELGREYGQPVILAPALVEPISNSQPSNAVNTAAGTTATACPRRET
jgi:hypothetical protein